MPPEVVIPESAVLKLELLKKNADNAQKEYLIYLTAICDALNVNLQEWTISNGSVFVPKKREP